MVRKKEMRSVTVLPVIVSLVWLLCLAAAPAWGAIYYVSTDGNDSNVGTSPKLAWRTITHAANKAQAGDLVRIKAGEYGAERVFIKNSGTEESPIWFVGYGGEVRLEGKLKKIKGKMTLQGTGVQVSSASHIKLSGLTVLKYGMGIVVNKSHHVTVENCTAGICGYGCISVAESHHCAVRRCTAYNCEMRNIGVKKGHDNIVADCWSYCDHRLWRMFPQTRTDYCYAFINTERLHVMRCRADGRHLAGHGLCFAAGGGVGPGCKNCRVTECEMYNCWELIGARHGSSDITIVNCYGESNGPKPYTHGFYYRAGAHNITVKNCRVRGVGVGFHAVNSGRAAKRCGVSRNFIFENCIATHCLIGIGLHAPNSRALNCLIARNKRGVDISNAADEASVKGCIVCWNDVGIEASIPTAGIVTHCNVWGNKTDFSGKAKPGEKCVSKDPQFLIKQHPPLSDPGYRGGVAKRAGPDFGHWHLKETSPCKDMGPYAADPGASVGMR